MKNTKYKGHYQRCRTCWDLLAKDVKDELSCARVLPEDIDKYGYVRVQTLEAYRAKFFLKGCRGALLDAGCGNGNFLFYALEEDSYLKYLGLDISKSMLQRAIKRINNEGIKPQIYFVQGMITELPFKDETFDWLICSGSLQYLACLEHLYITLNEFKRVLKSNGILGLDIFNKRSFRWGLLAALKNKKKKRKEAIALDLFFLSSFRLVNKLREIGFEIIATLGQEFMPIEPILSGKSNPWHIWDRCSAFIENELIPRIPLLSLLGGRVCIKARKIDTNMSST